MNALLWAILLVLLGMAFPVLWFIIIPMLLILLAGSAISGAINLIGGLAKKENAEAVRAAGRDFVQELRYWADVIKNWWNANKGINDRGG